MKIAHDSGEEHLQLMRQLGVEYVGPGKSRALEVADLVQKKEYYLWDAIESLSPEIYYKALPAWQRVGFAEPLCPVLSATPACSLEALQL